MPYLTVNGTEIPVAVPSPAKQITRGTFSRAFSGAGRSNEEVLGKREWESVTTGELPAATFAVLQALVTYATVDGDMVENTPVQAMVRLLGWVDLFDFGPAGAVKKYVCTLAIREQ